MRPGLLLMFFLFFFLLADAAEKISVKNFGAYGNGKKDDTKAIQNAIDHLKKNGGGTLYFPAGIYMVSNSNLPGKSFALQLYSNISIIGDGIDKSIIKLMSNQRPYTVMISIVGLSNIHIKSLSFDGNAANQPNPKAPSEHLHGIYLESSSGVKIDSCKFIKTGGDGVYIRMGQERSKLIDVTNCIFDDTRRNGLTLGSGFRNVRVANSYFGKKISRSPIDTEPTGGACGDLLIENNTIETQNILTLGGVSKTNLGFNQVVRNNKLVNCSIFIIYGKNISIENNTITNVNNKKPAITVIRTNENVKILSNKFTSYSQSTISITYSANQYPKGVIISNNEINYHTAQLPCFYIRGADNLKIASNKVITKNQPRLFMNITATRSMSNVEVINNEIGSFQQNFIVAFKQNYSIKSFKVGGNKFSNKKIFNQSFKNEKRLINANLLN